MPYEIAANFRRTLTRLDLMKDLRGYETSALLSMANTTPGVM